MSELKTKKNNADVKEFLHTVEDETKRRDALTILKMMESISWEKAKMRWSSIVWFWEYHYKYASGREWDWMITGFSPRKTNISIYIMPWFDEYDWSNRADELLKKLWKYKVWKSCLSIKKLEDIDLQVLEELIRNGYEWMVKKYH